MRQFQDFGQGGQQGGYGGYGMGMPQMGMGMGMPPMGFNVSCIGSSTLWDHKLTFIAIPGRVQPLRAATSDVRRSNGLSKRHDDVCCRLSSWGCAVS